MSEDIPETVVRYFFPSEFPLALFDSYSRNHITDRVSKSGNLDNLEPESMSGSKSCDVKEKE